MSKPQIVPVLTVMTPHGHQVAMKRFIIHIVRLCGESRADIQAGLKIAWETKEGQPLVFVWVIRVLVWSEARFRVSIWSQAGAYRVSTFHWRGGRGNFLSTCVDVEWWCLKVVSNLTSKKVRLYYNHLLFSYCPFWDYIMHL